MKRLIFTMLATTMALNGVSLVAEGTQTLEDTPFLVSQETKTLSSGRCGEDAYWAFDATTGIMRITGTGTVVFGQLPSEESNSSEWNQVQRDAIKTLIISEGITNTGVGTFRALRNLTNLQLPEGLITVSGFYECTSLTKVTLPSTVEVIGHNAFLSCTSLREVNIPSKVTTIADAAFRSCTSLTQIEIPPSVTTLGGSAFWGCKGFTEFHVPDTVTSMGNAVFASCTSLKTASLPKNLGTMPIGTFHNCTALTSFVIPDSSSQLVTFTFSNCSSLQSVTIPASVTQIGDKVFDGATSLKDVYYGGTKEQWDAIKVSYLEEHNIPLKTATVHYTESTPSTGTSTPSTGTSTPSTGTTTPSTGTSTPSTGTSTPSTGTSTPNTGTSTPSIPSGENIYPITGTTVNYVTQEQIAKFYFDTAKDSMAVTTTYDSPPSTTAPYAAGVLSQETNQAGLDIMNYVRYIAGLDHNLTIGENYVERTQAGALLNASTNTLTHYPSKPDGMTEELYLLGKSGAASSNLSSLSPKLSDAILYGWMADEDDSNVQYVGHRNWVLTPSMGRTAFGAVGRFAAMYSFDSTNTAATQIGVAWPAQNMPVSIFDRTYPWSFVHGAEANSAEVKLTRLNDGEVWNFSSRWADGEFFVNNDSKRGQSTIIFRPNNITYKAGDEFYVEITGEATASYSVSFFDVENTTPASSLSVSSTPSYYEYVHQEKVESIPLDGASSWATSLLQEANALGLLTGMGDITTKYQSDISREEFCRLILNVYRSTGKTAPTGVNPFSDTTHGDVVAAYHLGIVTGTSETTFSPENKITRQELAVMVKNTAELFTTVSGLSTETSFGDKDSIASWAKEAVSYCEKEGFLAGSDGNILPLDNLTCEQAIVVALRLAETFA